MSLAPTVYKNAILQPNMVILIQIKRDVFFLRLIFVGAQSICLSFELILRSEVFDLY